MLATIVGWFHGIMGDAILAAGSSPGSTPVSTNTGQTFADSIKTFVAPIVLLVIGLVAISFLFKRQLTQFFQFMALAVLAGVFFYTPGIVENIARFISGLFGAS